MWFFLIDFDALIGALATAAGVGAVAGYAAHHPPAPQDKPAVEGRVLTIIADQNNQCYLEGTANGSKFRFLADSGADRPYFSINDARALGFDPDALTMDHTYRQWGGTVHGATVHLQSLNVAGVNLKNVEAVIDQTDFGHPLLGATILKALHYQIHDGSCAITVPAAGVTGRHEPASSWSRFYQCGLAGCDDDTLPKGSMP